MTDDPNNNSDPLPTRMVRVTHHSPAHIAERYNYAGYGSNLWINQVARRCPDAEIIGAGHIPDCQLRFAYYATIKYPHAGATTPVAVYRFNARDVAAMDRQEGLGRQYERFLVTVTMADGTRQRCFTYVKRDDRLEAPSQIYYKRIEDGYHDWHFDLDILRAARAHAQRNGRRPSSTSNNNTTNTWSSGWGWEGRTWSKDRWEPLSSNHVDERYNEFLKSQRRQAKRSRDASGKFISSLVTGRQIRDPKDEDERPSQMGWIDSRGAYLPIEYLTDQERTARFVEQQTTFTNPKNGERWTKGNDGVWRRVIES